MMISDKHFIFEVCANGIQSLLTAQRAGATRVELCEAIELGGLTPSYGCLKLAASLKTIPVHVLIRPRGGHYIYSDLEADQIIEDILMVKELGFEGVVVGVLNKKREPDLDLLQRITEAAQGMHLTFHRAIDAARDPMNCLATLVDFGFKTVLSSGAESDACSGIPLLKQMNEKFGKQIEIMAGGGVNAQNAVLILSETGLKSLHFSAKAKQQMAHVFPQGVDATQADMSFYSTDFNNVEAIIAAVSN
ncbi:MAG: copper homeostasis protein CutC [Bacteroidetes bacterium]|nr:copper homeostasis protein CutC [Bacteroidota bacterium]MBU1578009.1 copper homeostasis protein CutC [Bacteroidota bacterium]MBU2466580.1 copper homeostasis protein CutC [Bacteroidota bacterium]MBU2559150.1 copper homeostasis protein CutC [Bacteroidota bacterium]